MILNWDEGQLEGKGSLRTKTKQEKGKGKRTGDTQECKFRNKVEKTCYNLLT